MLRIPNPTYDHHSAIINKKEAPQCGAFFITDHRMICHPVASVGGCEPAVTLAYLPRAVPAGPVVVSFRSASGHLVGTGCLFVLLHCLSQQALLLVCSLQVAAS